MTQLYFKVVNLTATLLFCSIATRIEAQDYLVGVRGGVSVSDPGYFRQVEAFAGRNLPWQWHTPFNLRITSRVEGSAGWLSAGSQGGFIGTLGPVIELREGKFPLTLEGGASPTCLSKYNFHERDIGGWFEFTDHIDLDWQVTEHLAAGVRFQHMSNASIYRRNPGLNLTMLSTNFSF